MRCFNNYRQVDLDQRTHTMGAYPLDVMVTGCTGAGKSSTLNSLFGECVATVGDGVDPETMGVYSYKLNDLARFWDTPGLGDGIEADERHSKNIIDGLYQTYQLQNNTHKYGLIDMVLVILEGSSRDMGTTYKLLNEVIVPHIQTDRILVAVNQCDMAMKGHHWNAALNQPDAVLKQFLDDKVRSIQNRVKEATNMDIILPVYYSAKYLYNMDRLMDLIIDHMPTSRRNLMC